MTEREELLARVIRRMWETGAKCAAPVRTHDRNGNWVDWCVCDNSAGHRGSHSHWNWIENSWFEWETGARLEIEGDTDFDTPPGPWTDEELAALRHPGPRQTLGELPVLN